MFALSITDDATDGTLTNISLEEADDLIDGHFKRWHAVNYTATMVIANGARQVRVRGILSKGGLYARDVTYVYGRVVIGDKHN